MKYSDDQIVYQGICLIFIEQLLLKVKAITGRNDAPIKSMHCAKEFASLVESIDKSARITLVRNMYTVANKMIEIFEHQDIPKVYLGFLQQVDIMRKDGTLNMGGNSTTDKIILELIKYINSLEDHPLVKDKDQCKPIMEIVKDCLLLVQKQ